MAGLHYESLDRDTRDYMLSEFELDISLGYLYLSRRFSPVGAAAWPRLLEAALRQGDDESLHQELLSPGMFNQFEQVERNGVMHQKRVPATAAATLAEGEFNRFYLRGVAARAISENRKVEVYRGRLSPNPRRESEALIGQQMDPQALLDDLRSNKGIDTALGLPPGPNSGITGKLV